MAKSEKRKAKSEKRKAKSEKRKAKSVDSSIVEPVLHLHRDHSRIAPVRPAKGVAVVQLISHIRDVGAGEPDGEILAEGFPERQIEGGVTGQMIGTIAVQEA